MTKHIHKYKKIDLSSKKNKRYPVWACQLPNCTHYTTKKQVIGNLCICWVCGETCIVLKENDGQVRAKPHCPKCTKKIKPESVSDDMLEKLGI